MGKSNLKALDHKVLAYVKAKGTVNVNRVARQFKVKWETAERSLKRLQVESGIFYHPDMKLWSIFPDGQIARYSNVSQTDENGNKTGETDVLYARFIPHLKSTVRGKVGQTIEKEGFLCHPRTRGSEVPRTFVRGHIHGHYSVEIVSEGRMPSTYADSDLGYHGKWYSKKMNGNMGYYGELSLPDDPVPFKFHVLSCKDGSLRKLAVYVHPRYIYHENNIKVAQDEFHQQVSDVLDVLARYGWDFGQIRQCGTYSMAINDRILASHVPVSHAESVTDPVKYDSSVGSSGDGVCTEAEILADHPTAEAEAEIMVNLPNRIVSIESRMADVGSRLSVIESRLTDVTRIVELNAVNTDRLVSSVEGLSKLTEFNTNVLLGQPIKAEDTRYISDMKKEDVMYG